MNRYQGIEILKETNGPRYYGSVKYPFIDLSTEDYYIITMIGDRLDNLANQFYGDSTLYWVLQIANEDCKRDSLYPPIGIQLRIPQNITKILQDFEEING
jgi:hypothetical protein